MKTRISITPEQARAIFDALQVSRSRFEEAIERHNAAGDLRLEQLCYKRWKLIDLALVDLGQELQDIAEPTYRVCTHDDPSWCGPECRQEG